MLNGNYRFEKILGRVFLFSAFRLISPLFNAVIGPIHGFLKRFGENLRIILLRTY